MKYSMTTMRAALERLGFQKGGPNPFLWQADPTARVPQSLSSQFYGGRGPNFLNDLLEYCWLVYEKSYCAQGPQLIGRVGDLWVPQRLDKANIDISKKETLWDPWTKGNIQVMDKWAPVVNDCWVLGGVHRQANFELVSKQIPANLWDYEKGYHVVTARELLGILHFGYEREEQGARVIYTCFQNPSLAKNATLEAYDKLMTEMAKQGPNSVTLLFKERLPGLNQEIREFDRNRLRAVPR